MSGINIKIGTISSKFHYPYEGIFGGTPAYIIKTLTGNGYIDLTNAVANQLLHLKLFGGTELTPETYIDSVTAEGKCEQRNLPAGYTQLEYVVFDSTQVIDTGFTPGNNSRIESKCYRTGEDCWFYGASPANPRITLYHSRTGTSRWGNQSISSMGLVADTEYTFIEDKNGLSINGTLYPWASGTAGDFTCDRSLTIGNNNGSTGTRYFAGNFYYMKIYDDGVLVRNFVPCQNSSNVVGLYDTVNGVFYTETGLVAGTTAVPTPTAPMDIVTNNGILNARHQSGLPLGYALLDYIQSSGSQYIDTLRVPNNNDIIEQKFQKVGTTATTCSWYGSMPSSQSITPRIGIGSFSNQGVATIFAGANYTGMISEADTNVHTLRFQATDTQELTYTLDGVTGVIDASTSLTPIDMYDPAVELTSYLFARHGTNGVQVYDNEGTKIYYHKEYLANGTLVLNMVPVKRNSDNVLGMYDLVSGQFFTNQGTGDFTAGNTVSDPIEIYTDGTTETIEDELGNTATTEMLLAIGDYIDTQEILSGAITRNIGIKVLKGTEDGWGKANNSFTNTSLFSDKKVGKSTLFCTHFQYDTGSTSNIPDMCIGCATTSSNTYFRYDTLSTVENWQQWLSNQYNAGTPVIVLYPLATSTTETVTGQQLNKAPVTYTGSVSGLTGTTVTSSHTTPTPTQPLKINCNNGVLKLRRQSGLPTGYTLLEYIESSGTQYIDTGMKPDQDCELDFYFQYYQWSDISSSGRVLGSRYTNNNRHAIAFGANSGRIKEGDTWFTQFYEGNEAATNTTSTHDLLVWHHINLKAGQLIFDNETKSMSNAGTFTTPYNMVLFGFVQSASTSTEGTFGGGVVRIREYKVMKNGAIIQHLVSAKNSSNVLGMYDLVGGQFLTNAGTGDFTAGNTVDDPMIVYADGTTETIWSHTKNLFSGVVEQGGLGDSSGAESQSSVRIRSTYIPVKPNTQYNLSWTTNSEMAVNIRNAHFYDASNTWISRLNASTFTTPLNTAFVRFVWQHSNPNEDIIPSDISNVQLEEGSTATTYVPYFNGGTATTEILLKIGDYADEQEILSGNITRKIGVMVLDGITDGKKIGTARNPTYKRGSFAISGMASTASSVSDAICSHFEYSASVYGAPTTNGFCTNNGSIFISFLGLNDITSAETANQWLYDQYIAGTPVIVLYPLATATTETVTGQTMNIPDGNSTIEITQASIDNLPLEVQYKATE